MNWTRNPRVRRFLREWSLTLAIPILIATSFRSAVADWNDVPTGSMIPTILEGERIFVNKLAYDLKVPFTKLRVAQWGDPQRGDVVICYSPVDGTRLVKRVVGVPGDELAMRGNRLYVNGSPLDYGPADPQAGSELSTTQQARHRFYTEDLTGTRHTVMLTPGRPGRQDFDPLTVPEGQYFMMGDNRDNSADSRYFGFIDREQIDGRVQAVVAALDPDRHWRPRWSRWFTALR